RRLPSEEKGSGCQLLLWILAKPVVKDDDTERIEELSLVLMDALHLAVEDGVGVHDLARRSLEPVGEQGLGLSLGLAELQPEALVLGERLQTTELSQVDDPAIADRSGNRLSERRVGQQQPPARRDPVRLVVEAFGEHLRQILHRRRSEKFR